MRIRVLGGLVATGLIVAGIIGHMSDAQVRQASTSDDNPLLQATSGRLPAPVPGRIVTPAAVMNPRGIPARPPDASVLAQRIALGLRSSIAAERDDALMRLLPELLASDPLLAADLVEQWPADAGRNGLIRRFARLWASTNVSLAIEWASGLPPGDRQIAGEAFVTTLAESDPASALEAAELFDVHQQDGRAERILQLWTEQDAAAAIAWLSSRPPGEMFDRFAARLAWALAQHDPAAAATVALAMNPVGPARDEAVLAVVRQWAARDTHAAAAWVARFPPGPLREQADVLLRRSRLVFITAGP